MSQEHLNQLKSQFVLGCENWYLLTLWRECGSVESAAIGERIRVAEHVLASSNRGTIVWAWDGSVQLVEHLIGRLDDSDPHRRQEAAIALSDLHGAGRRAVSVLLARLRSAGVTAHDQACSAWALGRIGGSSEIVPTLVEVLQGSAHEIESDELRRCAAEAIEMLSNDPEVLLAVARFCLSDRFFKCRLIGLGLVERLGGRGELVQLVEPLVGDDILEVQVEARRILSSFA